MFVGANVGAGLLEDGARVRIQDVHADLFEDGQRCIVDRFQFIG